MAEDSNVQVRWDIRPGDLGQLLYLHGILYAQEWGFDLTFEAYVAGTLAHFAAPLDTARERLWLAEAAGQLMGSIAVVKKTEEVAQLRWLLIAPAFRGRGLGAGLL